MDMPNNSFARETQHEPPAPNPSLVANLHEYFYQPQSICIR